MKKILWGTLTGGIFSFFFGWLVYGILLAGVMESMQGEGMSLIYLPEEEMRWLFLILSNLAWALFMAYIFVTWAGVSTLLGGLKAGAIICLLVMVAIDTSFYSMTTMFTLQGMVVDIVAGTIFGSFTGAVIGFTIGKLK